MVATIAVVSDVVVMIDKGKSRHIQNDQGKTIILIDFLE